MALGSMSCTRRCWIVLMWRKDADRLKWFDLLQGIRSCRIFRGRLAFRSASLPGCRASQMKEQRPAFADARADTQEALKRRVKASWADAEGTRWLKTDSRQQRKRERVRGWSDAFVSVPYVCARRRYTPEYVI